VTVFPFQSTIPPSRPARFDTRRMWGSVKVTLRELPPPT